MKLKSVIIDRTEWDRGIYMYIKESFVYGSDTTVFSFTIIIRRLVCSLSFSHVAESRNEFSGQASKRNEIDLAFFHEVDLKKKQGRIHGKTVADGCAGAVMQKPLEIQKKFETYRPTDLPTGQGVESRVRD